MLQRFLTVLVFALAILLVGLVVLVSGYGLLRAGDDAAGALFLWRATVACLGLIFTAILLLVGTLAVISIQQPPRS